MKKSNYNTFLVTDEGIVLAYNARTNSLAELEYSDYKKILEYKDGEKFDDENLKNDLILGGYYLEDGVDELSILKHDMYAQKFSSKTLSLTIAPTSKCNFRCSYCFERDTLRDTVMSAETIDLLEKFVYQNTKCVESFFVSWYGGEPLLELDLIQELSQYFIKICEERKIKYEANVITNGYFLTADIVNELYKLKINHIQITIDGTKCIHDSRRYLINGEGTFDKIMENLISFKNLNETEKPHIAIRINIDKNNKNTVFDLIQEFKKYGLLDLIHPYVAGVYDSTDIDNNYTLTNDEWYDFNEKVIDYLKEMGIKVHEFSIFYPKKINAICGCDMISSYVVDADASIYKCWEDIGHIERSVGNLKMFTTSIQNQLYYDYILNNPFNDIECVNCKVLPICMSGCPLRKIRDKKRNCIAQKKKLKEYIYRSYSYIKRNEHDID